MRPESKQIIEHLLARELDARQIELKQCKESGYMTESELAPYINDVKRTKDAIEDFARVA